MKNYKSLLQTNIVLAIFVIFSFWPTILGMGILNLIVLLMYLTDKSYNNIYECKIFPVKKDYDLIVLILILLITFVSLSCLNTGIDFQSILVFCLLIPMSISQEIAFSVKGYYENIDIDKTNKIYYLINNHCKCCNKKVYKYSILICFIFILSFIFMLCS